MCAPAAAATRPASDRRPDDAALIYVAGRRGLAEARYWLGNERVARLASGCRLSRADPAARLARQPWPSAPAEVYYQSQLEQAEPWARAYRGASNWLSLIRMTGRSPIGYCIEYSGPRA